MLYNIYKVTLVWLLCGVICEISGNTLSEKRLADMEVQLSSVTSTLSDVEERFEQMENNIQSINDAMSKLVFTLLERDSNTPERTHGVKKREVLSNNPLTNLPYGDLAGLRGTPGKDGVTGVPGVAGRDGRDGKDGIDGSVGPPGLQGIPGMDSKAGGAVYTRWGRTTCGSDSTLLYSGYAGGSNYEKPGGGVNYQCMPLDPQYNRFYDGTGTWWGTYVGGIEYESWSYGIFPNSAHDQNAPCASCYTNNRSALMMIPAKRNCSEEWNKEYEGYLMSGYNAQDHPTTLECVDASPEYINGEGANNHGGMFYFARTNCNRGGHCPPYDGSKEITCVVCSK